MNDSDRPEGGVSGEPRISYAIARLHNMVFASVSELAARHGLTALQFTTLSVLSRHGVPLSSSQLARRSLMTPQAMHEVIHRLEAERLIQRNPHPSHGRKLPASLTPKGRRILAVCEAALAAFEETMLKGFTKGDRAGFLGMMKAAVSNLGGGFGEVAASPGTPSKAARAVTTPKAAKPAGPARRRA